LLALSLKDLAGFAAGLPVQVNMRMAEMWKRSTT
jgi:hypothetical protein